MQEAHPEHFSNCTVNESVPTERHAAPPRKSHTKSRNGCLQCKKRKIKCGEEKPHCANCSHRGSRCEYASLVYNGQPANQPPSSLFIANLGASDFATQAPEMRFCLNQMRFFHHFLINVPHPLPLGNRKIWANNIPQIAHQHQYLMHAMLALGAAELNVHRPDISVQSEVFKHRGRAITGLQTALNDGSSWTIPGHPDAILATCYILVAQSSHMADATDDFNIAVRGCALVTDKLHREHIRTAFKLGPDDLHVKLRAELNATDARLARIPRPNLAIKLLRDLAPLMETSAARPFAEAIGRTLEKFQHSPADAYMESLSNFGHWYYLALGVVQCLRSPAEAVPVVILEGMLLASMIWLKVLVPLIIWPRYNDKMNPFPSKALLEASHWIEAIARWVPPESQHFVAWAQRVSNAIPPELVKHNIDSHAKDAAACVAAKLSILRNISNQAHTMLGSVLRLASELASWFEGHATANLETTVPSSNTTPLEGNFGPAPVPLGQLNHAFSRTLRTKRCPEPFPLDESVLESDRFP